MASDDRITEAEIAAVREGRRVPEKHEINALLGSYFVGPIDEALAERLSSELAALVGDPQRKSAEESSFRANSRNYFGQAWKEQLSLHDNRPSPTELAIWLAVTTPGYPAPRLYCPERFVGTWKQSEPRSALWQLASDGGFQSDEPVFASRSRWCVHRVEAGEDFAGDKLWLSGAQFAHQLAMTIREVTPKLLRLRYSAPAGPVQYRLERP